MEQKLVDVEVEAAADEVDVDVVLLWRTLAAELLLSLERSLTLGNKLTVPRTWSGAAMVMRDACATRHRSVRA